MQIRSSRFSSSEETGISKFVDFDFFLIDWVAMLQSEALAEVTRIVVSEAGGG